jgi:hypothetical protein
MKFKIVYIFGVKIEQKCVYIDQLFNIIKLNRIFLIFCENEKDSIFTVLHNSKLYSMFAL